MGSAFHSIVVAAAPTVDAKTLADAKPVAPRPAVFSNEANAASAVQKINKNEPDISKLLEEQHAREKNELNHYLSILEKIQALKKLMNAQAAETLRNQLVEIHRLEERVALDITGIQLVNLENFEPPLLIDYLNIRQLMAELKLLEDQVNMGNEMKDILRIPELSKQDEQHAENVLLSSIMLGYEQLKSLLSFKKMSDEGMRIKSRIERVAKKSADYELATDQLEKLHTAFGVKNIEEVLMGEVKKWEAFTRLSEELRDKYKPSTSSCCSC